MKTIIIGAGSDLGVHIDGARFAPSELINDMKSSYTGEVVNLIQNDKIIKSRNLSDKRKNEYEANNFNTAVYKTEIKKIGEGLFPITIGGDTSVCIASVLADNKTNKKEIGVIYFASHTHYNNPETTVTGNIDGMSLAAINNYKCDELIPFHNDEVIDTRKTVVVGSRNIDPWEKDNVKYSGITVISKEEIDKNGLKNGLDKAFEIATKNKNEVHICLNMDIIDPTYAPGVAIPEVDGITEEEAMEIMDYLLENIDKISGVDIVGLNPLRDISRKTEQIALNILANIVNKVEKHKNVAHIEKKY